MRTLGQNSLSVAILGPGAVGGFLSALFFKNGVSVTCIAKELTAEIIAKEGIRLQSVSFGDFVARPNIATSLDTKPDLLFVTTKATTLPEALKRVNPDNATDAIIIPLLNGIEHMGLLRSIYGKNVVAANIGNVELKKISVNHIVHSTPSAVIELASDGDIQKNVLAKIASFISATGIKVKLLGSEAEVLWGKLVRLNAIACTTSLTNQPLGYIRSDKLWRLCLENCVKEGVLVALAEGAKIDFNAVMEQVDNLPKGLGTSMQRDIIAGKPSEIDAIAGAVVRAGARHGILCPTIESLVKKINKNI